MPKPKDLQDLAALLAEIREWLDHGLELEERLREALGVKGPQGQID